MDLVKKIRKELKSNCLRFLIVTLCLFGLAVYTENQTFLTIAYGFAFVTFLFGAYEAYKDPSTQAWLQKIRARDEEDEE